MIFATTGTQLSFPRLIDALERAAPTLDDEIIAQVGPSAASRSFETHATVTPSQFADLFGRARIVVAHAGIGSILSAKHFGKPIILMPRRHDLGEHRNDHQMATAKNLEGITGVYIAWEVDCLDKLLRRKDMAGCDNTPSPRADTLLSYLRDIIDA